MHRLGGRRSGEAVIERRPEEQFPHLGLDLFFGPVGVLHLQALPLEFPGREVDALGQLQFPGRRHRFEYPHLFGMHGPIVGQNAQGNKPILPQGRKGGNEDRRDSNLKASRLPLAHRSLDWP